MIEVHNRDNEMAVYCDQCPEALVYEYKGELIFKAGIDFFKKAGWIVKKVGTQWVHFCSRECAQKYDEVRKGS